MTETILVGEPMFADSHEVGDATCTVAWCGNTGFPMPCKCGGLVHAAYGDDTADDDYWLWQVCDRCGDEYEIVYDKD